MRCLLIFFFISSSMLSSEVDSAGLKRMAAQFAPAPLRVDIAHLSAGDFASVKADIARWRSLVDGVEMAER